MRKSTGKLENKWKNDDDDDKEEEEEEKEASSTICKE
jgi:hypothetical protein